MSTPNSLGLSADQIEAFADFLQDPWKGAWITIESEVSPLYRVNESDLRREDGKPANPSAIDQAVGFVKPTITFHHPLFRTKVIAPAGRASKDGWKKAAAGVGAVGLSTVVLIAGAGAVLGYLIGRRS